MRTPSRNYIAVDPGKMSGVAILNQRGTFASVEVPWPDVNRIIEQTARECYAAERQLRILGERFDQLGARGRQDEMAWSLKILGVWQNEASKYGYDYAELGRSDSKNFMNNAGLKKLGWKHKGGDGHADDAARILCLDLSTSDGAYWSDLVLGSGFLGGSADDGDS